MIAILIRRHLSYYSFWIQAFSMKVWIRWYFFLAVRSIKWVKLYPIPSALRYLLSVLESERPSKKNCLSLPKQSNHTFAILSRFLMLFLEMLLHLFIVISWKQLTIFITVNSESGVDDDKCIFTSVSWQQKDHSNFGALHSSAFLKSPCFLKIGESTFEIEGLKILLQKYVIWSDIEIHDVFQKPEPYVRICCVVQVRWISMQLLKNHRLLTSPGKDLGLALKNDRFPNLNIYDLLLLTRFRRIFEKGD